MKARSMLPLLIAAIFSCNLFASDMQNRLGIGFSQELKNNLPALSFKLQKTPAFAFGGLLSFSSSDRNGGYSAGLKVYRIIFEEPLLNFYAALTGALISQTINQTTNSGFEFDGAFGSEFHFKGIESLGFSFEFGFSLSKLEDNFVFEVLGNSLIKAGVHFYL